MRRRNPEAHLFYFPELSFGQLFLFDSSLMVLSFSLLFLLMLFSPSISAPDCPLDFGVSNFTVASTICSRKEDRAKCCRYINALIAISVSRYANVTSNLGVTLDLSDVCLDSITQILALHGVTRNASIFCRFGTNVPVNYECQGRTTVTQMVQSPRFVDVTQNCKVPLTHDNECNKCVNAGIAYLRNLGTKDNLTFSTCRVATFAALASQVDNSSAIDIAACYFGVQGLLPSPVGGPPKSLLPPQASLSPPVASNSSQLSTFSIEDRHPFHLGLVPKVGIALTVAAVMMLVVLAILVHRKRKQLEDSDAADMTSTKDTRKFEEGSSLMFRKFRYKEIKKATNNFTTAIVQGGFGAIYKAKFHDGVVVAVKQFANAPGQAENEFFREIELLARLHHRHLAALKGFCIEKHKRFLMYEYMANGSLKDHLQSPRMAPLGWHRRIQIAIDVANALEYLHFYCNPPLCHGDIKSSNILLDENFVAKVAVFGLAHASIDGSICSEPRNTDIRGTPGYVDPEYVFTQELTEKSDVYSYGIVLLELVTARQAIQDNKSIVESSQKYLDSDLMVAELVDPRIRNSFDLFQLQTLVEIAKRCTQNEGMARPSIRQVLRLLYESADPMHDGFIQALEEEIHEENEERSGRGNLLSRGDTIPHSGDIRCLASSSSTSKSCRSRSLLLETGSP